MADGIPGLGNDVHEDAQVELEKLHMSVLGMANTLSSIQKPINDLYEKVIAGNGQLSLLTRVSLMENKVDTVTNHQAECPAPLKVYDIQSKVKDLENKFMMEQNHIEEKLNGIVDDLEVITDDDLFRKRKIWGTIIDGVKTLIIIGLCGGVSWITAQNAVDTDNNNNNTKHNNTSYIEEVFEDEPVG